MGRTARGFRIVGASWQVLKADRELMWLPVLSFLGIALVSPLGLLAIPAFHQQAPVAGYFFLFLFYWAASTIAIFFNAAIVGAAMIRMNGGDPTLSDGLRLARERFGKILGWAAISATVGIVFRALEQRAGFFGRIVIWIVGAAWGAVTFFVVPVLLFEPLGVTDSIKRSSAIFRQRWGEQFVGNVSLSIALTIIMLPAIFIVFIVSRVSPLIAIALGIAAFGVLASAGSAMSGIFNTALYRFATTGNIPGSFSLDDMTGAFRPKKKMREGMFAARGTTMSASATDLCKSCGAHMGRGVAVCHSCGAARPANPTY